MRKGDVLLRGVSRRFLKEVACREVCRSKKDGGEIEGGLEGGKVES